MTEFDEHRCTDTVTPAQQRARLVSWEIVSEGRRVVAFGQRSGYGRLLENESGCAQTTYRWGPGRSVEGRCRDLAGNLRTAWRTDEDGRYAMWFDAWGRPRYIEGSEAAGLVRTHDARGRVQSYAYVDAQRRPTTNQSGVHRVRGMRGAAGHLLEERYFDLADQPTLDLGGVHAVRFTLGERGGATARCLFGLADEPVVNRMGVHCTRWVLDSAHNWLEESWHGLDGQLVVHPKPKAARAVVVRDAHGGEVARSYFGTKGEPMMSRWHYASRKTTLDARGRAIRHEHFDTEGRPAAVPKEAPVFEMAYDEYDRIIESRLLSSDGAPFVGKGGWSISRSTRDTRGKELKWEDFGPDRRPLASSVYGYDDFGNRVRQIDYDAAGAPLREANATFDARGRMLEQKWHGPDGRPRPRGYMELIKFYCGSSRLSCADAERLANMLAVALSSGVKASKWLENLFGSDQEPALGAELRGGWLEDAYIEKLPLNAPRVRKADEGWTVFIRSG